VYSRVLQLVIERIKNDAATVAPLAGGTAPLTPLTLASAYALAANTDNSDARASMTAKVKGMAAQFLLGHVDRKVVKQTVMTSVYGVTFIGAREQILGRLKERFANHPLPIDELNDTLFVCASYLARTTLDSLGDLFTSADAIKRWLGDVARQVALAEQPMSWITPLGLPVVQPYRREHSMMVKTVLQDVVIADSSEQLPVSAARQKSAFPPNYVHSLDSTHMMLTALDCKRQGVPFTAVHDSYWSHACNVDIMAESLRDQFIKLYSLPLLEQFRQSLVTRFPYMDFPELPPRGTLDLNVVRHSKYFFN
jgi:DNA-directed RNA polymerase